MNLDHSIVRDPNRQVWLLFLALLAVKLIVWLIDPNIRFFIGDSESYLLSALSNWIPPDRSYTYPLVIQQTAVLAADLHVLILVQSLVGALTALVIFETLRKGFAMSFAVSALSALAVAVEPSQLFFERMVMAETIGTFCFVVQIYAGLVFLKTKQPTLLALAAIAGILAVTFRLNLLPVVLGFSLLPVSLHFWQSCQGKKLQPILQGAAMWLFGLLCIVMAHSAATHWRASLNEHDARPRYTDHDGLFRLGLVAPLVKPEHFYQLDISAQVLDEVLIDLDDHENREAQIWSPDGLVRVIERHSRDANTTARKLAMRAFRDDPVGLVRLGVATIARYFDAVTVNHRIADDMGIRPLSANMILQINAELNYQPESPPDFSSAVAVWYKHSTIWTTACLFLLAPLCFLVWWNIDSQRKLAAFLLMLLAIGMFTSHTLFSHIVSFRYLHTFPLVTIIALALWIDHYYATRPSKQSN